MSTLADTTGRIGQAANDVLVKAADYYVQPVDWNVYATSLMNTALVSPILPYIQFFVLLQSLWDPQVLLTKQPITLASIPIRHHWVFDLANANFFGFVSGNIETFDAWWVVFMHFIS